MGYTWRNDNSSFWPGHLDYFIASDSVVQPGRHFILYTPEMSPANLAAYGLASPDSLVSDHLLFCCDLRPAALAGDVNGDGVIDVSDLVEVVLNWGPCPGGCAADVNGDGVVNVADLVIVVLNWE
jgi:hypothetical protein